jgi:hypothetical protein
MVSLSYGASLVMKTIDRDWVKIRYILDFLKHSGIFTHQLRNFYICG